MKIAPVSVAALLIGLSGNSAQAALYNLNNMLLNPGFESGLTSWGYYGQSVNTNTYLTGPAAGTEWANQAFTSSSPFVGYTDGFLTSTYGAQPWGANPSITHVQQTGAPVDPTTAIAAAIGSGFVGSRQDGYQGHCLNGGSVCGPEAAFYDTNFQIFQGIAGTFIAGDQFTLTIWGNRGKLRQDWSSANSGSEIRAAVCSQNSPYSNPCASATVQSFTNWAANGQWASQTLTWTLSGTIASSQDIRVQITGINSDHDTFVAVDLGEQVVPVPGAVWLLGSALGVLGWIRRKSIS